MKEMKDAFDLFDADNSGEINASELKNLLEKLGISANKEELEQLTKLLDKNGNGKIEFNEFAKEMSQQYYKKHSRAELEDSFRQFDKDNSGYITAEELYQVMSKFKGSISRDQVRQMVAKIDKDNNNQINIDEFIKLLE